MAIIKVKISELPLAESAKDLYTIGYRPDADGNPESVRVGLEFLEQYAEDRYAYGVEIDTAVSSPLLTRIGNMDLHRSLPVQNRMKGCLLDDSGKVTQYLPVNDWTSATRDGSAGQVMVEIPEHWRKFETEGTKRRTKISEYRLPGYHFVPMVYVSAYEAGFDRRVPGATKLCSVVNMSPEFRGGVGHSDWDGTFRSLLGRPGTGAGRQDLRNSARRHGAGTQWNLLDYNAYKSLVWLYIIEYANLNSQAPFNAQKDANGYAQGGLGNGVTNMSNWAGYNGSQPFVPCGHTDALGNNSGEVAYDIPNADGTMFYTEMVPRYRGIENPFGHLWKITDGINVEVKSDADGGTSKVYVANDPVNYNDNNYTGYEMRGFMARTEGYAKEMILGEYGDIIPAVTGGGSNSYWCDYYYLALSTALRGVLLGGSALSNVDVGLGCCNSANAPSFGRSDACTRLCFIPKVEQ